MPGHDPDDEGPGRPVPDPLDRLWLHPTELTRRAPARRRPGWLLMAGAGATGALATVLVLALTGTLGGTRDRETARTVARPVSDELAARVAGSVWPSIVAVRVDGPTGSRRGSGVCVRSGYVLTSNHLVGDGTSMTVTRADGQAAAATVVGRDPLTELALLRADDVTDVARVSSSASLRVGQSVVEAAAPHDAQHWVSAGVVSALGGLAESPTGETLVGLIETDADSAPPGTALLDRDGAVVGIVAAHKAADTSTVAIPMSTAGPVVDQLVTTGHASHGWLGVAATDTSPSSPEGARVEQIVADGPAAHASLRAGDVITAVGTEPIDGMAALLAAVRGHRPGDRVELRVVRGTESDHVAVVLGEPAAAAASRSAGATTPARS